MSRVFREVPWARYHAGDPAREARRLHQLLHLTLETFHSRLLGQTFLKKCLVRKGGNGGSLIFL